MNFKRRRFIKALGAGAAAIAMSPSFVRAGSAQRVVVIGGGFAGATVAKYIRIWSGYSVDVTLVDAQPKHTSCVLSNLLLNRRISLSQLQIAYDELIAKYGVNVIRDTATEIKAGNQTVALQENGELGYDKLVIATGIGFDKPTGLDSNIMPHAWIAGRQSILLAEKLATMSPANTFIMTIPKSPYRCPPGPYERACLVADYLIRKGYGSGDEPKVLVLDANPDIQAEKATFSRAFDTLYRNVLEYVPNTELYSVDSAQGIIQTSSGEYQSNVINVIPTQQATTLVRNAGLTGSGRWAPVDPTTYESTLSGFSDVYVIGDSQGTSQPKSAHMANSQAKVCADAIVRSLSGLPTDSSERLDNITTNSACYSPITRNEASWLSANFAYDRGTGNMRLTHIGEAHKWNSENYEGMFDWASNLFNDSFR
jgi:sulfide dehydrogenase [flavocytochrome c] flavoprotein subunit